MGCSFRSTKGYKLPVLGGYGRVRIQIYLISIVQVVFVFLEFVVRLDNYAVVGVRLAFRDNDKLEVRKFTGAGPWLM